MALSLSLAQSQVVQQQQARCSPHLRASRPSASTDCTALPWLLLYTASVHALPTSGVFIRAGLMSGCCRLLDKAMEKANTAENSLCMLLFPLSALCCALAGSLWGLVALVGMVAAFIPLLRRGSPVQEIEANLGVTEDPKAKLKLHEEVAKQEKHW